MARSDQRVSVRLDPAARQMVDLHEHTARRLIAELRRRNDIDEMSLPAMWTLSECSESLGIPIDEVRRLAAHALDYRPGRGHRWRVSVEQVRALRAAAIAEARA